MHRARQIIQPWATKRCCHFKRVCQIECVGSSKYDAVSFTGVNETGGRPFCGHQLPFFRKFSSRSRSPKEEDHDPVKTRLVHAMVLGSFAVSAYTVIPFVGGALVDNSAKLLNSRDHLMQSAGAERLRRLASASQSCRQHMLASDAIMDIIVGRIEECTKPDVLENVLLVIDELLQEDGSRCALASNPALLQCIRALHARCSEAPDSPEYACVSRLADRINKHMR